MFVESSYKNVLLESIRGMEMVVTYFKGKTNMEVVVKGFLDVNDMLYALSQSQPGFSVSIRPFPAPPIQFLREYVPSGPFIS